MLKWTGAAGLCLDSKGRLLMILQGAPEDEKRWSVPAVIEEEGGSPEQAIRQEIKDVTGCDAQVTELEETKELAYPQVGIYIDMHYFKAVLTGGTPKAPAGDELIAEVAWKSAADIETLELMYPEERDIFISYVRKHFN